jgi:deoxyribodipyrimidine photo-lyase
MYKKSLFLFRRDLRLADNTGLITASNKSQTVIPVFLLNDQQIDPNQNKYFCAPGFQFMLTSLELLADNMKDIGGLLQFVSGDMYKNFEQLLSSNEIEAVFSNHDYTPFARARDKKLQKICAKHDVAWHSFSDYLLVEPEQGTKDDGSPYKVFTPFYRKNRVKNIRPVNESVVKNWEPKLPSDSLLSGLEVVEKGWAEKFFARHNLVWNKNLAVKGGRGEALYQRELLAQNYDETRNFPSADTTSYLSPHHKFGTLSIRESYWFFRQKFGFEHTVLSELFWRDFFTHIGWYFPEVFGSAFRAKYNQIQWPNDPEKFGAWCNGQTGFPLVDAGMRELNETGFMHNRVRMVVASFLIKNLHVDWRWGEKYFAQNLVDYDPCVNNGNWQWAASTGCDAQPYFRIFNPWSQQKKFDKDCEYIKKWIPELRDLEPKEIHMFENKIESVGSKSLFDETVNGYPLPIVNNKTTAVEVKGWYKGC